MSAHTITSVQALAANAGSLAGFEATCSCGFRTSTSLGRRFAVRQGWDHAEYMNRKSA